MLVLDHTEPVKDSLSSRDVSALHRLTNDVETAVDRCPAGILKRDTQATRVRQPIDSEDPESIGLRDRAVRVRDVRRVQNDHVVSSALPHAVCDPVSVNATRSAGGARRRDDRGSQCAGPVSYTHLTLPTSDLV